VSEFASSTPHDSHGSATKPTKMYVGAGIVKKKGLLPFHFDFLHFPRRTP